MGEEVLSVHINLATASLLYQLCLYDHFIAFLNIHDRCAVQVKEIKEGVTFSWINQ